MLQHLQTLVFRPERVPRFPATTQVRSAGEYRVGPSWEERGRRKDFHQLFWIASGEVEFRVRKEVFGTGEGEVYFYRPGEIHDVRPGRSGVHYFWLTLDSPGVDPLLAGFDFPGRRFPAGSPPTELFRSIIEALKSATPRGEMEATVTAYEILTRLAWQRRQLLPESGAGERLRNRMDAQFADPNLNIESLAEQEGMHRATVYRTFLQIHGISPSLYLQRRRLVHGLALLEQTNKTVQEIALASGYTDPNHFAKVVRRATGYGPVKFRQRGGEAL
ncbi:helix-turn-helix transcriptional regulator [Puniceicoccus vermicola]|uniref:AraC family transcriptional regulator n=1 Tax=Puniceicoccus vermicola TaxID=388746 RepID=A0A7X1B1G0_9BACT|nr:AraC family transcriptional regulator [Puniceicoccus vermicola]MBC2603863.1 AraC family transcriptional regulator [Puniceicoccus vermicola]